MQGDGVATGGPAKGRLRAEMGGSPLFKGYCFFFQSSSFEAPFPSKSALIDLVKRGGGKVISRLPLKNRKKKRTPPRENEEKNAEEETRGEDEGEQDGIPCLKNVVVCDPSSMTSEEAQEIFKRCGEHPVSVDWILNCLSHFTLLPMQAFGPNNRECVSV